MDLVSFASKIPVFPVERWFDLQPVVEARRIAKRRISWVTLYSKAYGLACSEVPEMRQFYSSIPWSRCFQSRYSVVSVAVNREYRGHEQLFFGRLRWPEERSLVQLQSDLDQFVQGDVGQVFRQQLRYARMPWALRRLFWWWRAHVGLSKRAQRMGTGCMSVLASDGVLNRRFPCPATSGISYGPLDEQNRMWVTMQCDHRLIDGVQAAQALNRIHDHLLGAVLSELQQLSEPSVSTNTKAA